MRRGRVWDPIGQLREMVDVKVWARSSEVIRSYSGGLLSLTVQVGGILVGGRSGWVMGKYSGGLLSSVVLEGR